MPVKLEEGASECPDSQNIEPRSLDRSRAQRSSNYASFNSKLGAQVHICNNFNPQTANVWLREGAFEVCSIFLKLSEFPACKNWEASL